MNATSRRRFILQGAWMSGALLIGFSLRPVRGASRSAPLSFAPNAFLEILPGGAIRVFSKFSEIGQGIHTVVAQCIAEELDAALESIEVRDIPSGPAAAHAWWGFQMTGGSSSTSTSFLEMRKAGALGRHLLVEAAARRWQIPALKLRTERNRVYAPDGRSCDYGELALQAAELPAPAEVALKEPSQFTLIGRPQLRLDSKEKVCGGAVFGFDVTTPGMLTALYLRPPVFGESLRGYDPGDARAIPGVRHIAPMASGLVVIAEGFWPAKLAANAVRCEWSESGIQRVDTARQAGLMRRRLEQPGVVAREKGDVEFVFSDSPFRIEAEFDLPYLAHACMEPVNASAHVKGDGTVEVWAPTQVQDADRAHAARVAGVSSSEVTLHTPFVGGAFGRKAGEDFVPLAVQASLIARAPVRLVWTREDDIRGGYYRPRTLVRARLGADSKGHPLVWDIAVASKSIVKGGAFASIYKDGLDGTQTAAFTHLSYPAEHVRVTWHEVDDPVPVLPWRDPAPIIGSFVTETLLDDAARLAGRDPLLLRLELLAANPRALAVLKTLAVLCGWPGQRGARALGVAFKDGGSTLVGEVAEVSLNAGRVRVHRVWVVVDCGLAINPDGVRAQMMSGVLFGLSAALGEQITLVEGQVVQTNFHDYPVLRMPDAPHVHVHVIQSTEKPGGVGEPSTPLIAPAVSNALLALTGRRIRTQPFSLVEPESFHKSPTHE